MSSYATDNRVNQDQRNFAEQGSALAGQGSLIAYPTSVSVFGSPESEVGDITFITHAPAPADSEGMVGLSDQLASIMSKISAPAPAIPSMPKIPGAVPAKKPNYILWAALAAGAFLIWRM